MEKIYVYIVTSVLVNKTVKKKKKTRQKLESERTQVYAWKPRLKMPFKNFIS
jgi:hypothetical protein